MSTETNELSITNVVHVSALLLPAFTVYTFTQLMLGATIIPFLIIFGFFSYGVYHVNKNMGFSSIPSKLKIGEEMELVEIAKRGLSLGLNLLFWPMHFQATTRSKITVSEDATDGESTIQK